MKAILLKLIDQIRTSFWFLPSLMAMFAVALAFGMVALDQHFRHGDELRALAWAYGGGAESASAVMQTIAGSMITIAGVVFSLTLVALSLASSQFGPRLLRNFMRDSTNQVVLGTFVATFLYCLLVLRAIRYTGDQPFVPHLSVTLGVAFALASLWVLIYFIHHVSVSIQADEIIARIAKEMAGSIERVFPQQLGEASPAGVQRPAGFDAEAVAVAADGDGYLQIINADELLSLATNHDAVLEIQRRPGHYVVRGEPLIKWWPGRRVDHELARRINSAFVLGTQRTPTQDFEYSLLQLVEVAVRALSPGVNDPFTAIRCIDRLGSALCCLSQREMPSPYRMDDQQHLRIIAPTIGFSEMLDAAFNQIRQNARANAAVSIRLLEMLAIIARAADRSEDLAAIRRHADMVHAGANEALPEAGDRADVHQRFQGVCESISQRGDRLRAAS
ncbi:DUF2254 domain-containing protein [Panacagrimonas sp.]|uniref:DUF2254 domain-containing protein n=1 Tax=Panacagrimonas sp. TaxID=2480088 RepID=UPI003B52F5D8